MKKSGPAVASRRHTTVIEMSVIETVLSVQRRYQLNLLFAPSIRRVLANRRAVPYQSLPKFLAERLTKERKAPILHEGERAPAPATSSVTSSHPTGSSVSSP